VSLLFRKLTLPTPQVPATMTDYAKNTVAQLKQLLTERGVDIKGLKLKADYVKKLEELDSGAAPVAEEAPAAAAPQSSPKKSPKRSPRKSPKKTEAEPAAAPPPMELDAEAKAKEEAAAAAATAKEAEAAELRAMKKEQERNQRIEREERMRVLKELSDRKAAENAEINKAANQEAARKAKVTADKQAAELAAAKAKAAAEAEAAAKAEANKKLLEQGVGEEEEEEEDVAGTKAPTKQSKYLAAKNKKKKATKKKNKQEAKEAEAKAAVEVKEAKAPAKADEIQIEYVAADAATGMEGEGMEAFQSVFARYMPEDDAEGEGEESEAPAAQAEGGDSDDEEGGGKNKLSKKKRKLLNRLSVAELKQLVKRPEAVEVHDVTASDPRLLIHLKSYRNTVSVPRHWCQKRKYLQGKRGIDKAPFELPQYIADTGITGIRESVTDKEGDMKLKQLQRQKMAPKMGKMDIDYQVLHDAFFRYQVKPSMTGPGDLYYEGKEFEIHLREKKPGEFSEDLKQALGMVEGGPPPWLINMQRYGPPPSFPNLKIEGLNAPIPEGASYGYHPGGWGKPPVDEYGRPLYGDVFGAGATEGVDYHKIEVDRLKNSGHWGELEEEEEGEEEEYEEDSEDDISGEEDGAEENDGAVSVADSQASSIISGIETPDNLDLRKARDTTGDSTPVEPKQLYQVIGEKEAGSARGQFMASSHTYDLSGAKADVPDDNHGLARAKVDARDKLGLAAKGNQAVDIALNPDELEGLDEEALKAKYNEAANANKKDTSGEDYSDILQEGMGKRKAKQDAQERNAKKARAEEFKF